MKAMICKAPAKINLVLDVLERRPDGYHDLETIFQTVSVYDTLRLQVESTSGTIQLHCSTPGVPLDAHNLVWKAADVFRQHTGIEDGWSFTLEKVIPTEAGLAGGSADGAAALLLLQAYYDNPLSADEVANIAASLGADVPFLLSGGTAYATGIGEVLTPLPDFSAPYMLLAKGYEGTSTAEAYHRIDQLSAPLHPSATAFRDALASGAPLSELAHLCGNSFSAVMDLPEIAEIKDVMRASGAYDAVMTGSGSAVYGFFSCAEDAKIAAQCLEEKKYPFVQLCHTVTREMLQDRITEEAN